MGLFDSLGAWLQGPYIPEDQYEYEPDRTEKSRNGKDVYIYELDALVDGVSQEIELRARHHLTGKEINQRVNAICREPREGCNDGK